jgi:hypothetical protein
MCHIHVHVCMYNHTCAAARDMKRMVFLMYSTSFGLSFALNSQPSTPHLPNTVIESRPSALCTNDRNRRCIHPLLSFTFLNWNPKTKSASSGNILVKTWRNRLIHPQEGYNSTPPLLLQTLVVSNDRTRDLSTSNTSTTHGVG